MNEIFKPIKGFGDKYLISNFGNIYSTYKKDILKPGKSRNYAQVKLSDGSMIKSFSIHRLVAEYFLSDWDPNLEVHHIDTTLDENGLLNNRISNLMMLTSDKNKKEAKAKPIYMLDKKTNEILKEFESQVDAASYINETQNKNVFRSGGIHQVLNKKQKTAYGYKWIFKDEYNIVKE